MIDKKQATEVDKKEQASGQDSAAASAADDTAILRESIAKLEAKTRELLQEKAEAKKAAERAAQEAAKKAGDIDALEKSWREKLESEVSEREKRIAEYQSALGRATIGAEARRIASELAVPGSSDVLLPHILGRLTFELKDGEAIVRVLDKNGKPSAATLKELAKEIAENPAFAPLIVGSKATGAGPAGGKASGGHPVIKRAEFDALSPFEKVKFVRVDKGRVVD